MRFLTGRGCSARCGLTIGCRGWGASYAFSRTKVLRDGPAPLTPVSLGFPGVGTALALRPAKQAATHHRPRKLYMKHKLDIFDNAVDSLNEALRKYEEGEESGPRAYKFAVLHFAHFAELLFKYYVSKSHPLLIYKNPFSKKIDKENTIGLWDAIQFLRNEGRSISPELLKDLEWMKSLRNDIEHSRFEMDVKEVRRTLGRLIRATEELNAELNLIRLVDHIEPDLFDTYDTLADEYRAQLAHARSEASEESEDGEVFDCGICGESATAVREDEGYSCRFCGEIEELVQCFYCEETYRRADVSVWNDEHPPAIDYVCDSCEDHIMDR